MSTSIKALLAAAAVMVLLFLLADRFGFRTRSEEPRTYVLELDTAAVVGIGFEDPVLPAHSFQLMRDPEGWKLEDNTSTWNADSLAHALLTRFQRPKVKRDMGMLLLLGERYQLTDSTRCRFTFQEAEGTLRSLHVGSSTFAPGKVGAWTYVNIPGEKQVYAVEGLLLERLRPQAGAAKDDVSAEGLP